MKLRKIIISGNPIFKPFKTGTHAGRAYMMENNADQMQTQLADATASIEATDSGEALRFYIGKAVDECMKLQAMGPISQKNVEHLMTQLAHDCYRVGYVADRKS